MVCFKELTGSHWLQREKQGEELSHDHILGPLWAWPVAGDKVWSEMEMQRTHPKQGPPSVRDLKETKGSLGKYGPGLGMQKR